MVVALLRFRKIPPDVNDLVVETVAELILLFVFSGSVNVCMNLTSVYTLSSGL